MRRPVARKFAVLAVTTAVVSVGAAAPPTTHGGKTPPAKTPVAVGHGGFVTGVFWQRAGGATATGPVAERRPSGSPTAALRDKSDKLLC